MKCFLMNRAKLLVALLPLAAVGCNGEFKTVALEQLIGFLSAVVAAATTNFINQAFPTT